MPHRLPPNRKAKPQIVKHVVKRKPVKLAVPPKGGMRLSMESAAEGKRVAAPAGMPTHMELMIGGEKKTLPVAYMWKDVIADGDYYDPKTGQAFSITPAHRAKFLDTVNQMRAAGVEIPAPVDHSFKAAANLGYVIGGENVGDRLRLLLQIIGEDAAVLALRNRASVYLHPEWIDGKGRNWGNAIVHCAFTPYPVVGGMGEFMPVAASLAAASGVPLFLARAEGKSDMQLDPKTKAKLQSLAVANGKTVEEVAAMSDEDLANWYMEFNLGGEEDTTETDPAGAAASVAGAAPKVDAMALSIAKAQNKTLGNKVLALSAFAPKVTDEETLRDRLTSFEEKVDGLVEKKRITPAQATKLKGLGKKGDKPRAVFLSRVGDAETSLAQDVVAILADDTVAPPTGTDTGNQKKPAALSTVADPNKGADDEKDKPMTPERERELMGRYYRPPASK